MSLFYALAARFRKRLISVRVCSEQKNKHEQDEAVSNVVSKCHDGQCFAPLNPCSVRLNLVRRHCWAH